MPKYFISLSDELTISRHLSVHRLVWIHPKQRTTTRTRKQTREQPYLNKSRPSSQQMTPRTRAHQRNPTRVTNRIFWSYYKSCRAAEKQLVKAEGKETGRVAFDVYWNFTRHIGLLPTLVAFFILFVCRGLYILTDWWVALWASDSDQDDLLWIWILISFATGAILCNAVSVLGLYALLINGSTRLHNLMLKTVTHSRLKFFHTNPTGRVLNRFSKDTGLQDDNLPRLVIDVLSVSGFPGARCCHGCL